MYTAGFEPFMLTMKIGALAGFMLATPLIMYQLWLFIAPGLYANEKKYAIPFVLFCTIFFALGATFSHMVAFPWAWEWFIGWQTDYMEFRPSIAETFGLYVKMLLGMALVFQMPTVVFFLARMGMVTAGFLARNTKYAILIIFIIAAVISPGHRRRFAGDHGRPDARALRLQHHRRLGRRAAETSPAPPESSQHRQSVIGRISGPNSAVLWMSYWLGHTSLIDVRTRSLRGQRHEKHRRVDRSVRLRRNTRIRPDTRHPGAASRNAARHDDHGRRHGTVVCADRRNSSGAQVVGQRLLRQLRLPAGIH